MIEEFESKIQSTETRLFKTRLRAVKGCTRDDRIRNQDAKDGVNMYYIIEKTEGCKQKFKQYSVRMSTEASSKICVKQLKEDR